uniref:EF-hand domain-containing protein n=1 Tax=Chrysotila carterae TaxID=13221 RepID=A0A7S4C0I7_CHRCT
MANTGSESTVDMDLNNDGRVTKKEAMAAIEKAALDDNGDGKVSLKEVLDVDNDGKVTEPEMAKLDIDGNGEVTKREAIAAHLGREKAQGEAAVADATKLDDNGDGKVSMKEALDVNDDGKVTGREKQTLDIDRDGEVTKHEAVVAQLNRYDIPRSMELFKQYDANNDGKLDLEEFTEMVRGTEFGPRVEHPLDPEFSRAANGELPYVYWNSKEEALNETILCSISLLTLFIIARWLVRKYVGRRYAKVSLFQEHHFPPMSAANEYELPALAHETSLHHVISQEDMGLRNERIESPIRSPRLD